LPKIVREKKSASRGQHRLVAGAKRKNLELKLGKTNLEQLEKELLAQAESEIEGRART
jgi:hypothetical protein